MQAKNSFKLLKFLGQRNSLFQKNHWLYGANFLQKSMLKRPFSVNMKSESENQDASKSFSDHENISLKIKIKHSESAIQPEKTADDIVKEDIGLNKFLAKIYGVTGLSFASSLGLSYALAVSTIAIPTYPALFGGLAVSIAANYALYKIKPEIHYEKGLEGKIKEIWINPLSRKIAFCSLIGGISVMTTPATQFVLGFCPVILPLAAGLSIMMMGGSSLYALNKPLGHFKPWKGVLYGGLFTLVGMNLMSVLLTASIGPNFFSMACSTVYPYFGLALFSGLQAYDTHQAIKDYKAGKYDYLEHAANFFLNIKNMFVELMSVMVDAITNIFSSL